MPRKCRALTIISTARTPPLRRSAGPKSKMREISQEVPRLENHLGRPHFPASVIGRTELQDEGKDGREVPRVDNHPGRPHFPASVIGRTELQDEGKDAREVPRLDNHPGRPHFPASVIGGVR